MSLAVQMMHAQPGKFGLWPSVWKLLRLRARIWWNNFRRAKLRAKIGTVVVLVLILGGMGFLFFLSTLLLRFLQSPEATAMFDARQVLRMMPTLVLSAAFVMTVLTNFGVLLQALYLSRDMDFLVTTPLPMRAVFLAKLLEAILPNFALFCAFSLPVLFGLGLSGGYSILYYPLLVIVLGMLALAAGGIASILVMAVVRVVPARRVAEVLGFLGAISSILCGQSGNLINAMDPDRADVTSAVSLFTRFDISWSPIAWAGRGLDAVGQGALLEGMGLTVLSLAIAGGIFAGTLHLAESLYYTGWASMQGSTRKKRNGAKQGKARTAAPQVAAGIPAAAPQRRFAAMLPSPVLGMVIKDFLLLRRDPRNLSNLITPLIVGIVMLFTTRGGGRNSAAALQDVGLRDLESYGLLMLAIFVGWMLMFNLASLAFSREGRSYWLVKTSPIHPWHLLGAKFAVSYLPAAAFSLAYLGLAYAIRGADLALLPFSALVLLVATAGAAGIALAFGVAGANFEWDSPQRQRLSGSMGCVAFLVVSGFLVLAMALFLLPPGLWQILAGQTPAVAYLIGLALGGTASAAAVFIPLRLVVGRLQRIGEKE